MNAVVRKIVPVCGIIIWSLLLRTYGADIPKAPARIVDSANALKDPNIVVADQKIRGNDPLSQAASAYVTVRSRAKVLNLKHAVDLQKALNGKQPTVEEFVQLLKEHGVEFNPLRPFQMYGYDGKTGAITILENTKEKAAHYKKAGIPID